MVCINRLMHIMDKQVVAAVHRRRKHSVEFKQALVARSLEPGVSVAALAMDHGINANLLFGWRRGYLRAQARQTPSTASTSTAVLLPVSIEQPRASVPPAASPPATTAGPRAVGSAIEIEIGNARIRLRGTVDETALRMVLAALRNPA